MVLLVGGARSGKSQLALALAARYEHVTFLATATAGDEEMEARIARHRAERPAGWRTVEEPVALGAALEAVAPDDCLVIDCLSFWVANLLARSPADDVERAAVAAAQSAARRLAPTIAVSNEVGMGVVPVSDLGRAYRDVLGRVNAIWAQASERALLVVAGQVLALQPADASGLSA